MLEACTPYARWVDVFCEPHSAHAFDDDEARPVLRPAHAAGLGLRVHGNQSRPGPGVRLAVELGAASVDHCTFLTDADVEALVGAAARPSRRCCPASSSRPGRPTPTRGG